MELKIYIKPPLTLIQHPKDAKKQFTTKSSENENTQTKILLTVLIRSYAKKKH